MCNGTGTGTNIRYSVGDSSCNDEHLDCGNEVQISVRVSISLCNSDGSGRVSQYVY